MIEKIKKHGLNDNDLKKHTKEELDLIYFIMEWATTHYSTAIEILNKCRLYFMNLLQKGQNNSDDINIIVECNDCKGTGIYKGWCEEDRTGVICFKCNGNGYKHLNFNKFKGRKRRNDIDKIYSNHGGCEINYEEWLNGVELLPNRNKICPFDFSKQKWICKECEDLKIGQDISKCPHRVIMDKCWEKYDFQNK